MWLVIIGGGVVLYVVSRALGWPQAKSWSDVADRLFMVGAPWQIRAVFFLMIGGGSAYHLAKGSYGWYWWLLPAVAGILFVDAVVNRRKP